MDPDMIDERSLTKPKPESHFPSKLKSEEVPKTHNTMLRKFVNEEAAPSADTVSTTAAGQPGLKRRPTSIMHLPLEIRRKIYQSTIRIQLSNCPRKFSNLNAFPSRRNGRTPQSLIYAEPNSNDTNATAHCNAPNIIVANRQIHHEYIQEIFQYFKLQLFVSNCPTNEVYCTLPISNRHTHSLPPKLSLPPLAASYLTTLILTFSMESNYSHRAAAPHQYPDVHLYRAFTESPDTCYNYLEAISTFQNLRSIDVVARLGAPGHRMSHEDHDMIAQDVGTFLGSICMSAPCSANSIRVWISFADDTPGMVVAQKSRMVVQWAYCPSGRGRGIMDRLSGREGRWLWLPCRTCWYHEYVQLWWFNVVMFPPRVAWCWSRVRGRVVGFLRGVWVTYLRPVLPVVIMPLLVAFVCVVGMGSALLLSVIAVKLLRG